MAVYLHEMLCSLICFLCFFWDALKSWVEQVLSVVRVVQSFSPKKMESERKFHLFQIHILIKRKPQLCLFVQQNVQGIPNNIAYQFVYLEMVSLWNVD